MLYSNTCIEVKNIVFIIKSGIYGILLFPAIDYSLLFINSYIIYAKYQLFYAICLNLHNQDTLSLSYLNL